ncbi:MAG: GNAT family N-acetyltransferase [Marinicaulis sp.]|nr:GNAT family N-acetyltransferase [Marinicaulis sp.]
MMTEYIFTQMTANDLPLVGGWLAKPFVAKWWGDPEKELADIADELDEPHIRQWIVSLGERQVAFIQDYDVHQWPQPHTDSLPPGALGIDMLIGDEGLTGKGHGSAMLRQHALALRAAGAPAIMIDPAPDNLCARRAYEKAGFNGDEEFISEDGPIILMMFEALA